MLAVRETEPVEIGATDEAHAPVTAHAAVAVVETVDRRVVLVVAAQRGQVQQVARTLRRLRVVARDRMDEEARAPVDRAPFSFARAVAQVEATRGANAFVEILETLDHRRDVFADAIIIGGQFEPRNARARQGRRGKPCDDRGFRQQVPGRGPVHARRQVHHAHRILDRDALRTARLQVDFGATEAGQDQRLASVHEMRAIELGRDVRGEMAASQRGGGASGIRRRRGEVAAEREEQFCFAAFHRADRADHVVTRLARRLESEASSEPVEERGRGLFVDAHRAVTLHVGMAAHRARAGAAPTDVAAQQQQRDQHLDRGDRMTVLGNAHAPGQDRRRARRVDRRGFAQLCLGEAGTGFDRGP